MTAIAGDAAVEGCDAGRSDRLAGTAPAWAALYAAIALDVVGLFLLAGADGLARPVWAALALAAFAGEVPLFAVALSAIEASIAYAVYGLGTAAVAVISIVALDEPASPLKVVALAAIVAGVATLSRSNAKLTPVPVPVPAAAPAVGAEPRDGLR